MLFAKAIIAANDLDENATIFKVGSLDECETYASETHWRVVIARFNDGTHCAASVPCRMK